MTSNIKKIVAGLALASAITSDRTRLWRRPSAWSISKPHSPTPLR
jgi:hypothetical protein